MQRPLLQFFLWVAGGTWAADVLPAPWIAWAVAASCALAAALLFHRFRPRLLGPALALLAAWRLATLTQLIPLHDLRYHIPPEGQLVSLSGILTATPSLKRVESRHGVAERTWVPISVSQIDLGEGPQPACGEVLIAFSDKLPAEFFRGQSVVVSGALRSPPKAAAPGLFDFQDYLRRQNIHFLLTTDSPRDWRLGESPRSNPPWSERFVPWAQTVLARGLPANDPTTELVWAIALGWKTALSGEVDDPFMRSGTLHVFAISGFHVALIAGAVIELLRLVRLPKLWSGILSLPLVWAYVAATGWQASAVRSAIMLSVIVGGWLLNRPSDLLNSLAAAALAIVAWDPHQLFLPGFQLSFSVVASLALFQPALFARWNNRFQHDPMQHPATLSRLQKLQHALTTKFGYHLCATAAAWLGALPLTVHYFHLVNPISLLANLIVVPLSGLALCASLGAILCADWLPQLGELFNASAWLWTRGMVSASQHFASVPGGAWNVSSPSLLWWIPYYVALTLVCGLPVPFPHPSLPKLTRLALAACAGAALLQFARRESQTRIAFLPNSPVVLIDHPGHRHDLLLNTGNPAAARSRIAPFLRAQGLDRIPNLVLTHPDLAHAGGWKELTKEFLTQDVFWGELHSSSPVASELQRAHHSRQITLHPVAEGDLIGPWVVWHPQGPGDPSPLGKTDQSLALSNTQGPVRILLTSDLTARGQRQLAARLPENGFDVVASEVPAASEPAIPFLLERSHPQHLIVSALEFPASRRLAKNTRRRLEQLPIPVWLPSDNHTGALLLQLQRKDGRIVTAANPRGMLLEAAPTPP